MGHFLIANCLFTTWTIVIYSYMYHRPQLNHFSLSLPACTNPIGQALRPWTIWTLRDEHPGARSDWSRRPPYSYWMFFFVNHAWLVRIIDIVWYSPYTPLPMIWNSKSKKNIEHFLFQAHPSAQSLLLSHHISSDPRQKRIRHCHMVSEPRCPIPASRRGWWSSERSSGAWPILAQKAGPAWSSLIIFHHFP